MTLHINTITPNHIISVSDRLLSTPTGYIEDSTDRYKHFVLITDDARVIVTFSGFAGIIGKNGALEESTIDWLTNVIMNTAHDGHHRLWEDHIKDIKDDAEKRIGKLQYVYNIPLRQLQLAIFIAGDYKGDLFGFIIDNSIEKHWTWAKVARTSFRTAYKDYSMEKFEDGCYIAFLGHERLAMKQRVLLRSLERYARNEDIKNIFQTSVNIIRAVSKISDGSVGWNCSGVRITRNNHGIEAFDDRDTKKYDVVMPNCVYSTSKCSYYVANLRGRNLD
jgi:hypothetical protein